MRPVQMLLAVVALVSSGAVWGETVYLNRDLITVTVGDGTRQGSFNNTFSAGNTLEKVIDAPTADAEEIHNQQTHIWFTAARPGDGLELIFDFGISYDIETVHVWNYTGEGYDVDEITFRFFDAAGQETGSIRIEPALGSAGGIKAEDIPLKSPLNVRRVVAMLVGSNQQIDFQNIGFTARVSDPSRDPVLGNGTEPCVPSLAIAC